MTHERTPGPSKSTGRNHQVQSGAAALHPEAPVAPGSRRRHLAGSGHDLIGLHALCRAWDLAIRRSRGAQTAFSLGTAGSGETDPGRFEFRAVSFLQGKKAQSIAASQIALHMAFHSFFVQVIGSAFS